MTKFFLVGFFLIGIVFAVPGMASPSLLPGKDLSLFWGIPFVGLLLSLAFFPLIFPTLWHSHFGKITLGWGSLVGGGLFYHFGWKVFLHEILVTYLLHYFPFILLAGALFTIAGGIRIHLRTTGTPLTNTSILAASTFLASFIGTTGAAMLFIRPLMANIKDRRHKTHTMVFFILLVCNVGGCLSPLGDPPLFLGYLFGVDFFWPLRYLIGPFLLVTLPLLGFYFLWDRFLFQKEDSVPLSSLKSSSKLIDIKGSLNMILLLGVMGSVLLSGNWVPGISFNIATLTLHLQDIVRDILLLLCVLISLSLRDQTPRRDNQFTWAPLVEVAKLFAGIFITAVPVMALLNAGKEGALGSLICFLNSPEGVPLNQAYFWLTGLLSSFLDNAPTYMIFFYMASGDAATLMTSLSSTLMAISVGAVFMGALTYIGNAPNFMVKSMAESHAIKMPSFFAYMGWAFCLLGPFLALISWVYFGSMT